MKQFSAKKNNNLIDPTNRSHLPIPMESEHSKALKSLPHGVATVSRIDQIIVLFCRILSHL